MKVKFNKIANFVAGQSPKSEYYSKEEGTPFLQGNRTFGMFYPKIDTYTKKVTKTAHKGDILMSVRAPVGDLNFAPEDICIGRGLASITAKDGDNAFLFYALLYNIKNLLKQSNGTTYASVTGDIVKNMDMIIPKDKTICRKISSLLYSLDYKIENNKKIKVQLEAMAKVIYDYWFLQFDFPNEEGKPYQSSGGKMVWNEAFKQEIPQGWQVKEIHEYCNIFTGKKDVNQALEYGTYKFYSCSPDYKFSNEKRYEGKAILISGNGSYTGRTLFVNEAFDLYQRTYACTNQYKKDYMEYIYYTMLKFFVPKVRGGTHGSAIPYIIYDDIAKQKILINEPIMDKFMEKIKSSVHTIIRLKKENEELMKLKNFLLPLLMNEQITFKKRNKK